jgi:hypothetical protein
VDIDEISAPVRPCRNGWLLRMEYQNYVGNTSRDNRSILQGVEKRFDP